MPVERVTRDARRRQPQVPQAVAAAHRRDAGLTLHVQCEGPRHPHERRPGGVEARAELHVLVPPGPVEVLAPTADLQRQPAVVRHVAAVEAVVGVRVDGDPAGVEGPPVTAVAGAVRQRRRQIRKAPQARVHVRPGPEPARHAQEPPQAERRDRARPMGGGVRGDEPGGHHHVVVDAHHDVALGGGEPAVAGPGGREAGPREPHPLGPQPAGGGRDRGVRLLRGRAAHHHDLRPAPRVGLPGERPEHRREHPGRPAPRDHDAHRGRPVPGRGGRSAVHW